MSHIVLLSLQGWVSYMIEIKSWSGIGLDLTSVVQTGTHSKGVLSYTARPYLYKSSHGIWVHESKAYSSTTGDLSLHCLGINSFQYT
jgi:hypothetical protein